MPDIMSILSQLIGALGFPIVCCVFLFKELQEQRKTHAEAEKRQAESIRNNTDALRSLSEVINKLLEHMGG